MAESQASPKRHSLEGAAFQKALERYSDETKPDQLVLQQIQGWEMQWRASGEDDRSVPDMSSSDLSFEPTDVLQGVLTWKSDYMAAEIECYCCWEQSSQDMKKPAQLDPNGSLYFVMRTKLQARSKHSKNEDQHKSSKGEKKSEEKIRSKMTKRLKEDSYIKRLLADSTAATGKTTILCEARVSVSNSFSGKGISSSSLEERVDVADNAAEGLRRALFSQAESALDVVEMLLSLPLLPGSTHDTIDIRCPLADRAKLRLLEDAMFDACEREGEDELINDLKISGADTGGADISRPLGGEKQKEQSKTPNRSSKRGKR